MLTPILPGLTSDYCNGDTGKASRLQGASDSVCAALGFLGTGVIGALSDQWGRRPFFIAMAVGMALPYFALALAPSHMLLFYALRGAAGLVCGGSKYINFSLLCTFLADCYGPAQRTVQFGTIFGAVYLGSALSPLVNVLPRSSDAAANTTIFTAAAVLCAANIAYCVLVLPESRPLASRQAAAARDAAARDAAAARGSGGRLRWWCKQVSPWEPLRFLVAAAPAGSDSAAAARHAQTKKVLRQLGLVAFLGSLPESGILDVSLYYLKAKLGFGRDLNGWLFFGFGLVGLLAQTLLLRVALGNGGAGRMKYLLAVALLMEALHFLVYAWSTRTWEPFIAIGLAALYLLSAPALNGIVTLLLSGEEQGLGLGVLGSLKALCGCFGPSMFTGLYSVGKGMSPLFPELPFYVSAAFALAACAVAATLPVTDAASSAMAAEQEAEQEAEHGGGRRSDDDDEEAAMLHKGSRA
jgi:DHA1 family tetracycline resistance protein-like MFS transporter